MLEVGIEPEDDVVECRHPQEFNSRLRVEARPSVHLTAAFLLALSRVQHVGDADSLEDGCAQGSRCIAEVDIRVHFIPRVRRQFVVSGRQPDNVQQVVRRAESDLSPSEASVRERIGMSVVVTVAVGNPVIGRLGDGSSIAVR